MRKVTKWASALAAVFFAGTTLAQQTTLQVRINKTSDDAEERGANANSNAGLIDLSSSDLELVRDGGDGDQFVGMHFEGIVIPQGSQILDAYIQFTVDEADAGAGTVILKVEDDDNPTTFTSTAFDISSRATVNDSVVWDSIPAWNTIGAAGKDQRTPDLSRLVQNLVNRAGWASGSAINIIATGTGERTAESYDGSAGDAPLLVIKYIAPVSAVFVLNNGNDDAEENLTNGNIDIGSSDLELTTESSDQLIGVRFDGVSIPQGSTIQNAYIQFTVDEVDTAGQVDVAIGLQNSANAAPLASGAANLSNRNYLTTNPVLWNVPDWLNVGDNGPEQQTPDFSAQLQQIVSKGAWRSGNAILVGLIDPANLGLSGFSGNTAHRVAASADKGTGGDAAELVVTYIPSPVFVDGGFPVNKLSSWKYLDNGTDLTGTNWTSVNYNDSTWDFGNGILGYGNGNETTVLDFGPNPSNKYTTTYLRHTFDVQDSSVIDSLVFELLRDDGAVVYINGMEAFRSNMPAGNVNFNTFAASTVGGASETEYFEIKTGNLLQNGRNVIAVELHQATAGSSDLSFDLSVDFERPPLTPAEFPLPRESRWHYLANGVSLDGTNWKLTSFNDDNWEQGQGPLGYGDPVNTVIPFGPDPNNKYQTYYFRRDININLDSIPDTVQIGVRRDDGAAVYINGKEVIRQNLPSGPLTYNTVAPTFVGGGDENAYFSEFLPKSVFKNGINTIAVEVKQAAGGATVDLQFDLFIKDAPVVNSPALGCVEEDDKHIACFQSIAPGAQSPVWRIPGSHKFQVIAKQGDAMDIINNGITTMGGNNDFTGYIATNGSSRIGHVSVNQETTPGGVTMIDVSFDDKTNLWSNDTMQGVDFFNGDLVTTTRNCSGGITPWGTVITSEETRNSGDVNGDGYTDVGWQVEINPFTAEVIDHDGDGKQDKLWAMGRFSHENVVIASDNKTAYEGEDGGSSAVFKFVADNPKDLTAGKLYALQLDAPLSGGEPTSLTGKWIQIPNTTQADLNNTSSLAISLGATNFNGVEDIEISPLNGMVYFVSKGFGRTYRFEDNDSAVSKFKTFVGGKSYVLNTDEGVFVEPWGTGNDNLVFDNRGNLWVLQDGGNDYIWVVPPSHTQEDPKVELFAVSPTGSEPCGLTFTPDNRYGFLSIQHPSGGNSSQLQKDAAGNDVAFDVSTTVVIALAQFLGEFSDSVITTDNGWEKSTEVEMTNRSGMWNGANDVPADSTFTLPAQVGQPYGFPSINPVEGASVIKTENNITFFRREFRLDSITGALDARFRTTVDDQAEIYVNGTRVALISSFGRPNFKSPSHDVKFEGNGNVVNGFNGGDSYDVLTNADLDTVFQQGTNEIIVAVRNLNKASDLGGFSFRLDIEEADSAVTSTAKKSTTVKMENGFAGLNIYPNPTMGVMNVTLPNANEGAVFQLQLTNVSGQVLVQKTVTENTQIDLSDFAEGVYFLNLQNGEEVFTQRIIKGQK